MVFGGITQERLQLNEGTLWAGGPYDPVNPEAKAALPEVRRLVNDGKYREAPPPDQRQGYGQAAWADAVSNNWRFDPFVSGRYKH